MSDSSKHTGNKLSFFKQIATKYKVSVINESTLGEIYTLRLSALRLLVLSILLIVIILITFSALVLFTPLNAFLPEKVDNEIRNQAVRQATQIDSLTEVVDIQNSYMQVLKDIISGDIILDTTDVKTEQILETKKQELLLEKSEAEKEFAEAFEEEEKFNLLNTQQQVTNIVFFNPVRGIITSGYDPKRGSYGLEISTQKNASVSSIYNGLVFNITYELQSGYTVEIAHQQNFISTYRGLDTPLVKIGEYVKTGQVIGNVSKQEEKPHIHFELWNETNSLDPKDYIPFN